MIEGDFLKATFLQRVASGEKKVESDDVTRKLPLDIAEIV